MKTPTCHVKKFIHHIRGNIIPMKNCSPKIDMVKIDQIGPFDIVNWIVLIHVCRMHLRKTTLRLS